MAGVNATGGSVKQKSLPAETAGVMPRAIERQSKFAIGPEKKERRTEPLPRPLRRVPTNSTGRRSLSGAGSKCCFVGYKSPKTQGRNFSGSSYSTLTRLSVM